MMRIRKPKPAPERSRNRQATTAESRPAFSYYTSRPQTPRDTPAETRRKPGRFTGLAGLAASPRRLTSRLPYVLLLAVLVLCAVRVLSVSSTPKIIIVGETATGYVQPTTVYQHAAETILRQSAGNRFKLTFNASALTAAMQRQFPELQSVSAVLPLVGNRPVIYVAPLQPSLVLQAGGKSYLLSHSGVVLSESNGSPTTTLPIQDKSGAVPHIGQQALPASTISFAEVVSYQLKAAKVPITSFTLPQASSYELDVQLAGKPYLVKFNLQSDSLEQSGALIAGLDHLGATIPVQYIDVRVPGRIYYK